MNATELQLRRMIAALEERIKELEDSFDERVRQKLLAYGLIEGAAEDE